MDAVYLSNKQELIGELWRNVRRLFDWLAGQPAAARRGDLGGARRAARLRLLAAHVLGRVRARDAHAEPARLPGDTIRWRSQRDAIYEEIMTRWSA